MTFLVNEALVDINIGTAGLVALLGYLVVFFGLVLLMCVILIMGKIMVASRKKQAAKAAAVEAAAAVPETPAVQAEPAPGSAGEIMLHDVAPRDAAMIMAIVANKMGKPINELRFKSIKEVK